MEKKLGIWVVLLVGVVMVAYGFFTINDEKEIVSQVIENEVETTLVQIENKISIYLKTYENLIKDISLNDEILYDEQEEYKGFSHMDAVQDLHPELKYIYYGSETGKMLLWPETELPEGYDPRERPWYQGALNSEKVVWTPPYVDASSGQIILSGALQVFDDHQLNGVLGYDLNLDQDIFLSMEDLSIDYDVMVLSEWGTIIHHKDANLIGLNNLDGEISQGIESGSDTFEYVPYRTVNDLEQIDFESNSNMPVESKEERTAFVRTNHLGWSIVLTVNTDDLK